MANYLPVLITSVSTNAAPDDSSLVTLPRGQVDYLSHDWQEEDVWRSWRNMTRQKNEITNGVRLENASWRTWWKQRNKLKTISPETLNWLKDSDVTWLYGPLHTAVEWTPPPKPAPVPDSVDQANPASAHDRLDLSSASPRVAPYKPILKHRSISELLTSDLPPTSPIFSPVESEDEGSDSTRHNTAANSTDPTSLVSHSQFSSSKSAGKRPTLSHTKSDTHITRWGPSRAFRKDSPPRIDPPGFDSSHNASGYFPPVPSSSSSLLSAGGPIRASLSQESNSSENGAVTSSGDSRGTGGHHSHGTAHKKKHISFNTFVEQCIAIEKPKKNASGYFGASAGGDVRWPDGRATYADDDGYDEDEEDSEGEEEEAYAAAHGSQWQTPRQSSGARAVRNDSDSPIEEEDEDEDDAPIEMRSSSSYRTRTPKPTPKKPPRSQSKVSTTSSSSSTSTSSYGSGSNSNSTMDTTNSSPSGSLSPSRRTPSNSSLNRKSSTSSSGTNSTVTTNGNNNGGNGVGRRASNGSASTYRPSSTRRGPPPLIRTSSDPHRVNVTIAPIAPTILKTTGAWTEGFGDEGASDDGFGTANGWGWSDKRRSGLRSPAIANAEYVDHLRPSSGGGGGGGGGYGSFGMGKGSSRAFNIAYGGSANGKAYGADEDTQESDGTPVELVYVPPSGSNYSLSDMGGGESGSDYDQEQDLDQDSYTTGGGLDTTRYGYHAYLENEDEDSGEVEQVEDVASVVYHHPPSGGMGRSVGYGGGAAAGRGGGSASNSHQTASASIPIANALNIHGVPSVVVNNPTSTVPSAVYRGARAIPRPEVLVEEEEDAYDFFEGPDLGEDYYYARRGGRGYEREREKEGEKERAYATAGAPTPTPAPAGTSRNDRDRGSDRRHSRSLHGGVFGGAPASGGAGEERQSRSRSRSQSRTPSPAFTVSPTAAVPVPAVPAASVLPGLGTGVVVVGRRRSSSASSPSGPGTWISTANANANANATRAGYPQGSSASSSELLSPPSRGRQPDIVPSSSSSTVSYSKSPTSQPQQQQQGRGRSSTRTSSSSSWERERGSSAAGSLGGSPIGSLSPGPDGLGRAGGGGVGIGAVLGGAAVLAGSGRADREREREREKEREKERGRERRGRDRTSGKVLTASETESLGRDSEAASVVDGTESGSSSGQTTVGGTAQNGSGMDASFYSAASSSSSSTNTSASNSTIVGEPAPTVVPAGGPDADDEESVDAELRYFRRAEEEQRRRVHPTPSNSPVVEMRRVAPKGVGEQLKQKQNMSASSGSGGTTPTGGGKTPSPPLTSDSQPVFAPVPTSYSAAMKGAASPAHNSRASASPVGGISASQPQPTSTNSNNSNSPSNKLRPPPLIPAPAAVAKPSTSFTAVSSPRYAASAVAGLSSPVSPAAPVPSTASAASTAEKDRESGTIVGKAVDMVSSAGAFWGWWGRDSAAEGQ